MNRIRVICLLIALCLLLACVPTENPTETSSELEETASTPSPVPTPKDAKEAALLYEGEHVNLYCARSETELGIIVEESDWEKPTMFYQPLPGTEGQETLRLSMVRKEGGETNPEQILTVYYTDANGELCGYSFDHTVSDWPYFYPVSDRPALTLTEDSQRAFGDVMLIGYQYEEFRSEYAGKNPDGWEALCQRRILDALYILYEDMLPPYLKGEFYGDESDHCSFVTTAELDGFFRSVIDRPNLVPDRMYMDEEDPDLLPGQVPIWPTDYHAWATVKQVVWVSDSERILYGYGCEGEGWCRNGVICRVVSADGYLGWKIKSTDIYKAIQMERDSSIVFIPREAMPYVMTVTPKPVPTVDPELEAALLFRGEHVNLYRGRNADSWGIILEECTWANRDFLYQPLPGTEGLDDLKVTGIRTEPDEYAAEALICIRYCDANGAERTFCLEHPASDERRFYPVTDEPTLTLSKQECSIFEDLMVIGVLYDAFPKTFAQERDDWEMLCQRTILDALFSLHDDALPPYLSGEAGGTFFVLPQTELDEFFRCTVDRPNFVPDRAYPDDEVYEEQDWSKLQPGQVPIAQNDWFVWAVLTQAVQREDGSVTLYGYTGFDDSFWNAIVLRVVPADGFLGWRIVSTEVCGPTDLQYDPSIVFVPAA